MAPVLRLRLRGRRWSPRDGPHPLGQVLADLQSRLVVVEGELVELRPWTALRVPASSARSFEADADGLEFLAFGAHTESDRGEFVDAGWPP